MSAENDEHALQARSTTLAKDRATGRATNDRAGAAAGKGAGASSLLPVVQKASDHPCYQCSRCCNYVAVEIDRPSSMKEYDHIYWYLYHGGVSVFVDWENDWFIQFESRCQHLTTSGMCGIYERRPAICKDFDWRECEQTVKEEPAEKHLFEDADAFTRWFQESRPKAYQRYQRFLRKRHASGEEAELVRLEPAGAPAPGRKARKGKGKGKAARRSRDAG